MANPNFEFKILEGSISPTEKKDITNMLIKQRKLDFVNDVSYTLSDKNIFVHSIKIGIKKHGKRFPRVVKLHFKLI